VSCPDENGGRTEMRCCEVAGNKLYSLGWSGVAGMRVENSVFAMGLARSPFGASGPQ